MKHIFMMHNIKKHYEFKKVIDEVMKGYDYEIIFTSSIVDSQNYIKQYPVKARFYIVGGDGTLNDMIQVLVHTEHEVVVLPLGTGNDFCHYLTQEKDPKKLLIQSLELDAQKIDTVLLNDRYYINAACFGVDSVIATHVHDVTQIPFVPEDKSYLLSIAKHVFTYKNDEVKIIVDDRILYHGQIILCTFNNAKYYGGGFPITPKANIQDGYIDLCIVDKVPKYKIPYLITVLLREKLYTRSEVHSYRIKEATVYCQNTCNMDGEEFEAMKYHFLIQPSSLNFVLYK
ncbi:MAG: hypothetical protein LUH02_01720 [Erysipelotrichaceae bacterium]|nr:hypothetical protein [Erysipelotrichaceae bacterium]